MNFIILMMNKTAGFVLILKTNELFKTNYQIKSYDGPSLGCYPKSWIIEGLNDNGEWENLSTVNDCSYLSGPCHTHIFPVTNPNQKKFRSIRTTQTGKNCGGGYYLNINCFE
mgnify:CR=1 FL=1